jgi:hypothetical protein
LEVDPTTPISVVMPDPPTAGSTTGLRLNITFTQQELLSIVGRAASVAGVTQFAAFQSTLLLSLRPTPAECDAAPGQECPTTNITTILETNSTLLLSGQSVSTSVWMPLPPLDPHHRRFDLLVDVLVITFPSQSSIQPSDSAESPETPLLCVQLSPQPSIPN